MTASEKRAYAAELMKSREKKNSYTQGSERIFFFGKPDNKPGNTVQSGRSDCSAAVRACIKEVTGVDIGANTSAQINNRTKKGIIVHETDGYYPDESKLLPGDCLYFKGNTSHPLDVGHVEMYTGKNECYGHGSGIGPTKKNLKDYCKSRASSKRRYFMAIRWIKDEYAPVDDGKRRNLKRGDSGDDVAALQYALLTLGYNVGSWGTDGDLGASTESAVRAFQGAENLLVTGIVDELTWRKIDLLMGRESGPEDNGEELEVPVLNGVEIANGKWNVRTGPGIEFAIAGTVRGGDVLEKVAPEGWVPVMFGGEVRWIGPNAVKK